MILLILLFYALSVRTRVFRNISAGVWLRVYKVHPETVLSKGKTVPLQARGAQRKLRFPDYVTMAQEGGKFVSLTHRPIFTPKKCSWYSFLLGTAVAHWLRCCATNRKVAGSIPDGVIGIFSLILSFRSHYCLWVDAASNKNEYQEHFVGVKAAGA